MITMPVKIGEYKGHKTISLTKGEDDKYPFTFGLGKARLIVENIEDIRKFVDENAEGAE